MPLDRENDLARFITAQALVFDTALAELQRGHKQSHWMWFVFPQLKGLGSSYRTLFYGIASLDEARAYLAHPLLGPRLDLAARTVIDSPASSLHALFGSPDDVKFCSSMTLFALAADSGEAPYQAALDRWCDGQRDERTLALLAGG